MLDALKNKYLVVGIISYVLAAVLCVFDFIDADFWDHLAHFSFAASIIAHLKFYDDYSKTQEIYNIEQLFSMIITAGLVALFVNIFPDFLDLTIISIRHNDFALGIYDFCSIYATMTFFLFSLMMYKKLIFVKANPKVIDRWKIFLWLLMAAAAANIFHFDILPDFVILALLITGLLIVISLIMRVKWIAFINRRVKLLGILYLLILLLISIGLTQKLTSINQEVLDVSPLYRNTFFILLVSLVIAYDILSLLALIFNLPISSVIEGRTNEVKSYQEINRMALKNRPIEDTFKLLFKTCYNNTDADAGWLVIEKNTEEERAYHISNITRKEIELFEERIDFEQLAEKKGSKKHHYFSNLVKKGMVEKKETPYRSMLVFPVSDSDKLLGTIALLKNMGGGFDEYTVKLASSYVDQAKLAFENAKLFSQSIENARFQEELEIARKVQQRLLPRTFPDSEKFEIAAFSETAHEVGGDYYDYAQLDSDHLALVIADVSGSGTSAAFYMAELKGIFHALIRMNLSVKRFLELTNMSVADCLEKGVFITLTIAFFDFSEKKLYYGRAGHTQVLQWDEQNQKAYYLDDEGLGLGIIRDKSYSKYIQINEKPLNSGDTFVFFTDGINESRNIASGEEYGFERLRRCVQVNNEVDAKTLQITIYSDFKDFSQTEENSDDNSLILVKIK